MYILGIRYPTYAIGYTYIPVNNRLLIDKLLFLLIKTVVFSLIMIFKVYNIYGSGAKTSR
jgi:hypothetical protein